MLKFSSSTGLWDEEEEEEEWIMGKGGEGQI